MCNITIRKKPRSGVARGMISRKQNAGAHKDRKKESSKYMCREKIKDD